MVPNHLIWESWYRPTFEWEHSNHEGMNPEHGKVFCVSTQTHFTNFEFTHTQSTVIYTKVCSEGIEQLITIHDPVWMDTGNKETTWTNQNNQSINQLINQSINESIHQSISPSIHQSINPSIHQSINPSIHPSINQSNNIFLKLVVFRLKLTNGCPQRKVASAPLIFWRSTRASHTAAPSSHGW